MDPRVADLLVQLRGTLWRINEQIAAIEAYADSHATKPALMQTTTGDFLLTPLLVAKAQVLTAITTLTQRAIE